ncbi:MAG: DUF2807 domain-containing protein [Bacteroidales bacterium]|nr:DUF2807 domain-containing protein [Bacteroidales bacterium]
MKKMLNVIMILSLLVLIQSGCVYGLGGIKGNGNVVKEERKVSSFDGISVGGAFKVYLTQGSGYALVVEADENLLAVISTEVSAGTLKIKTTEDIRDSEALNIYITFKELKELDISGACNLVGENKFNLDDLDMECSGASNVEMEIDATEIEMDFSGASDIELAGSATKVNLDLSGASSLDAYDLQVNKLSADISGASHAKVSVSDELSADVSGAASIKYKGEPTITNYDVSGAASIKKY